MEIHLISMLALNSSRLGNINIHDNNFVDFTEISGTSVSGASIDITFNKFNMEVCTHFLKHWLPYSKGMP
jgi:hypothetical protein